jgi:hypothetical protein
MINGRFAAQTRSLLERRRAGRPSAPDPSDQTRDVKLTASRPRWRAVDLRGGWRVPVFASDWERLAGRRFRGIAFGAGGSQRPVAVRAQQFGPVRRRRLLLPPAVGSVDRGSLRSVPQPLAGACGQSRPIWTNLRRGRGFGPGSDGWVEGAVCGTVLRRIPEPRRVCRLDQRRPGPTRGRAGAARLDDCGEGARFAWAVCGRRPAQLLGDAGDGDRCPVPVAGRRSCCTSGPQPRRRAGWAAGAPRWRCSPASWSCSSLAPS